jgi:hypothetical protein
MRIDRLHFRYLQRFFLAIFTLIILSLPRTAAALDLIVHHAQGCARDAINLLEQVRFGSGRVSTQAVQKILGHVDDQQMLALVKAVLHGSVTQLLLCMKTINIWQHKADALWYRLGELIRASIWLKYGIEPSFAQNVHELLMEIIKPVSLERIHQCAQLLQSHESTFLRTTAQHAFLEMILLSMCVQKKTEDDSSSSAAPLALVAENHEFDAAEQEDDSSDDVVDEEDAQSTVTGWPSFLQAIRWLPDQLIFAVLSQARAVNAADGTLQLHVPKELYLFHDHIEQARVNWQPLLKQHIDCTDVHFVFDDTQIQPAAKVAPEAGAALASASIPAKREQKNSTYQPSYAKRSRTSGTHVRGLKLDVSDEQRWPNTNLVLKYFSGDVYQMRERQS